MTELNTYSKQKLFEICGSEIPQHKLLVLCVYRTPTSDPNAFLVKLDQLLHYLSRKYTRNTKIVLAGDLNINTLKKGKVTNYLRDLCLNHNLQIHINVPTRKESCIDHIISNIKDAEATVLPLYLPDHDTAQLLVFPVDKKDYKPKTYNITRKDYCFDNIHKFRECMRSLSWSEVYSELSDNFTTLQRSVR